MPIIWTSESGPAHGPYAEAWFDERVQIHRVRLTEEGKEKVADYLCRYPHPIALLISMWPTTYRAARAARLSNEEIDSLCLEGVVQAFTRYDPTRGAAIGTAILWGIRATVGNAIRHARRRLSHFTLGQKSIGNGAERYADKRNEYERMSTAGTAANGRSQQLLGEGEITNDEHIEEVTHYLSITDLTDKERDVLVRRFGLGDGPPLSGAALGLAMRLSAERVRQLQENAIRKIRKTLRLDVDWAATARLRIMAYLASLRCHTSDNAETSQSEARAAASKTEICKRTSIPMWQLREVMRRLIRDGLVIRERKSISRNRWCIVFRITTQPDRSMSESSGNS
jgi:hypothetical protein